MRTFENISNPLDRNPEDNKDDKDFQAFINGHPELDSLAEPRRLQLPFGILLMMDIAPTTDQAGTTKRSGTHSPGMAPDSLTDPD